MYYIPIKRDQFLRIFPQGKKIAEIGVAEGDFAKEIIEKASPSVLHLVDPWVYIDDEKYQKDSNNVPDDVQQERYEKVQERFRDEIKRNSVQLHRKRSREALDDFRDGELDWVYIDGNHTYERVLYDLKNWSSKIREDGFVLGHDFTNGPSAQNMNFGVVEAVEEFLANSEFTFFGLTAGPYPTFVLHRSQCTDSSRIKTFEAKLIKNIPVILEVKGYPGTKEFQQRDVRVDGKVYSFPTIS